MEERYEKDRIITVIVGGRHCGDYGNDPTGLCWWAVGMEPVRCRDCSAQRDARSAKFMVLKRVPE